MPKIPSNFREMARIETGTSILDSGGIYGRHWEEEPIPADMPLEYAEVWRGRPRGELSDAGIRISSAQLFDQTFTIDAEATAKFYRWAELPSNRDDHWLELAERYCARMIETQRWSNKEGNRRPCTFNTYNWENDLDQVVQFIAPGLYDDVAIIQFHNGCDVRGGYTAPVIARGDVEELLISDKAQPYCQFCDDQRDSTYDAGRNGWRYRVNARTVGVICGKCHRTPYNVPIDPQQLAREAAKAAEAKAS